MIISVDRTGDKMDWSLFSLITRNLYCSGLILLLCLCCHSRKLLKRLGPSCIMLSFIVCIIRMFVPLNFSYIYHPVLRTGMNAFRQFLEIPLGQGHFVTAGQVLMMVWGTVFLALICRKAVIYVRVCRYVMLLPEAGWAELFSEYHLENESYRELLKCRLVYSRNVKFPCLVGCKKRSLLLPKLEYDRKQLQYILLHEQMHMKNRDIWRKLSMDFLCICFWWNPVFSLLRKEYFGLIEMRNDLNLSANLPDKEIVNYMECLKDIAIQSTGKMHVFGIPFSGGNFKNLKRRMALLADSAVCKWQQMIVCVLLSGLLVLTFSGVLPPYHFAKMYGVVRVTSENTCLIKNGKGYDIYINDQYAGSVKTRNHLDDIPICISLEEYLRRNREGGK